MRGLLITATDTGAGKTVTTCWLARELACAGHRVGCYKPVCSGCERHHDGSRHWGDIDALAAAIGNAFPHERICPQRFDAPLAPPAAAQREGRSIDSTLMRTGARWWSDHVDVLLIEGVGGLLCPIATNETLADLARDLGFPIILVSPLILGSINHTLMTIEVARHRDLRIAGIIFNDVRGQGEDLLEGTLAEISTRTTIPLVGMIPFNRTGELRPFATGTSIDWMQLAAPPRKTE